MEHFLFSSILWSVVIGLIDVKGCDMGFVCIGDLSHILLTQGEATSPNPIYAQTVCIFDYNGE